MRLQLHKTEAALAAELQQIKAAEEAVPVKSVSKRAQGPIHPTFSENVERDGYEIRFGGAIPKELSKELSLNGWRFNPGKWKDPRWWTKRSPKALAFARELVQRHNGTDSTTVIIHPNEPAIRMEGNEIILPLNSNLKRMLQLV